jgi:hypothetical protein
MTDFPNSPTLNQEFTAMGRTWLWNGTAWQALPVGLGWSDIKGKPTSFAPSAHAASHATGEADAISPASIGAATSAQGAKADSALQSGATISNISGLQTALDGKASLSRSITNALIFG